MPLPVNFAGLAGGNQSLALMDTQFAAVGALVTIPCSASGQNAITLTPNVNTPTITAYSDWAPIFVWTQPQTTTTSPVTISVAALGFRNAYRNNGQTAIGSGDLVAGAAYRAFALSSLNGGAGGFVVDAVNQANTASGTLISLEAHTSSATITIPNSASSAFIRMWGATGGTGGSAATVANAGASGGSGSGSYGETFLTGLTPGNTLTWTRGAPGAAGTNAPTDGTDGGTSTLSSGTQTITTLTCPGSAHSAAGNAAASAGGAGSAVATNFSGLNIGGFAGTAGLIASDNSLAIPGFAGAPDFGAHPGRPGVASPANGAASAGNTGSGGFIAIAWYV